MKSYGVGAPADVVTSVTTKSGERSPPKVCRRRTEEPASVRVDLDGGNGGRSLEPLRNDERARVARCSGSGYERPKLPAADLRALRAAQARDRAGRCVLFRGRRCSQWKENDVARNRVFD